MVAIVGAVAAVFPFLVANSVATSGADMDWAPRAATAVFTNGVLGKRVKWRTAGKMLFLVGECFRSTQAVVC